MKLLMDTHIWIWLADNPSRLSRRAAQQLVSPRNEVLLSSVSIWEFVTLARTGRFSKISDPFPWLDRALGGWPLREAGLSWEIAQEAGRILLPQGDPADHLIVATARILDCTLVTQDAKIIASGLVKTLSEG